MVLPMTRPWKHPKTGVYWLRKRVPADLIEEVGRDMVTQTLGTKDPEEAKRRLTQVLADVEAKWASLREGPRMITDREAHFHAKVAEANWLSWFRDNPSEQLLWDTRLFESLFTKGSSATLPNVDGEPTVAASDLIRRSMRNMCLKSAKSMLEENGFSDDQWSLYKSARAVGEALQRASLILRREERGEFETMQTPEGPPAATPSALTSNNKIAAEADQTPLDGGRSKSMTSVVEAWWKESSRGGRKPSTYESYSNTFSKFIDFVQHDDITRVTRDDIIRFKDFRFSNPSPRTGLDLSPRTVASDLAGLKSVFGWAVANNYIDSNPAEKVIIKFAKAERLRGPGFTDDEALAILNAVQALKQEGETAKVFAAKRWVPWLCAFTGARVGELAQLRKQDVCEQNKLVFIRITPAAGTVKTNRAREVPLHAQLVDLGFLNFVKASGDGHLFLNVKPGDDPSGVLQSVKNRLAEFSRQIVPDPNVAPNHGWRHRFKTIGRRAKIEDNTLHVIQGHKSKNVGDNYGEVELETMAEAIQRLPYMKVKW